jgi:hypothetical protein
MSEETSGFISGLRIFRPLIAVSRLAVTAAIDAPCTVAVRNDR